MTTTKDESLYWPDGTFKTKTNAFTVGYVKPDEPAFKKIDRDTRSAIRSARNVEAMRARGVEPAKLTSLTIGNARYSPPVFGREAGEKQRNKSDSIRRGGIL